MVDDYHPETSQVERRRMEATAQSLARAFGDGAERGRLRADLALQESMPPRSVAVISGEDMPNIGESGLARYYVVNIKRGEVEASSILTEVQRMARQGALVRIMRGYIQYLAERADELCEQMEQRYTTLRDQAVAQSASAHGRAPEAVAHIMLGYETMLAYFGYAGAMDKETMLVERDAAWNVLISGIRQQAREANDERPSRMYLRAVSELLASKTMSVKDISNPESGEPGRDLVGYRDTSFYYFIPGITFRYVSRLFSDQGQAFPLGERMLYKQMREDGVLLPGTDGKSTRVKQISGRMARYLTIPRGLLDGSDEPETRQMSFIDVSEPGDPFKRSGD